MGYLIDDVDETLETYSAWLGNASSNLSQLVTNLTALG